MSAFNEKKWFVYIVDHHEGPFSVEEIQTKMNEGVASAGSYIWAEGMSDWKPMTEVEDFNSIVQSSQPSGQAEAQPATATGDHVMSSAPRTGNTGSTEIGSDFLIGEGSAQENTGKMEVKERTKLETQARRFHFSIGGPQMASRLVKTLLIVLLPLALIGAGFMGYLNPVLQLPFVKAGVGAATDWTQPYMLKLVEKIPALSAVISPIARLEDTDPTEYEEMKKAAMPKGAAGGTPQFAIALSQADLLSPTFYVAADVADGAQYRILVVGVGDTLVNHTSFESTLPLTFQKRIAKAGPFKMPDGAPLPKGDYMVNLIEFQPAPQAAPQAGAPGAAGAPETGVAQTPNDKLQFKVYAKKLYFLGGTRDASYEARLKEFHERYRTKASSEIAEVKQLASTLEMQLSSTLSGFDKARGKPAPSKKGGKSAGKSLPKLTKGQTKMWQAMDASWNELNAQLAATFQKWNPETMKRDLFYFRLYEEAQTAFQNISAVHKLHQDFFSGSADQSKFESMKAEAESIAKASVDILKSKIEMAEKLPVSPKGLPSREGL